MTALAVVLTYVLAALIAATATVDLATTPPPSPAVGAAASPAPLHAPSQTTPTVWRITFRSQAELARLAAMTDPWEVDFKRSYILTPLLPAQAALLASDYHLEPDDDATARLASLGTIRAADHSDVAGGIPGFACYRTVEETYTDLADLARQHPHLARWIDIGDSWSKAGDMGGYDIHVLVLTNRARSGPKFRFFLMGAIHARELTTAETATRFAEKLVTGYGVDPDVTWLLDYGEVHILPVANPDGRKLAEDLISWRKNTNSSHGTCPGGIAPFSYGIDLNRNSSYQWNSCDFGACSSADPCSAVYRGESPASEPETQAIQEYLSSIFPARSGAPDEPAADNLSGLFISLHSYGQWVLYPWGYTGEPAPDDVALRTLGRKFGFHTGYQVCQSGATGCLYPTDGTTDDWVYGELGIPAYTFELGTWFFQSCAQYEEFIEQPTLDALLLAFKAAQRPLMWPAGPDIVDITPASPTVAFGHPFTLTITADDTRFESNGYGEEAIQPVRGVRVSAGTPPWSAPAAVTLTLPMSQTQPRTTVDVPVSILPGTLGRHFLFVQAMDDDGNWGLPTASFFTIEHPSLRTSVSASVAPDGSARPGELVTFTVQITHTVATSSALVTQDIALGPNWNLRPGHLADTGPESGTCHATAVDEQSTSLRWQVEITGGLSTCRLSFGATLFAQPSSPTATIMLTTTDQQYPQLPLVDSVTVHVAPTALHLINVSVDYGPFDSTQPSGRIQYLPVIAK